LWPARRTLAKILRDNRFDIVHVNGSPDHRLVMLAMAGMGRQRPRVVYTKHNNLPISGLGASIRAHFATDRTICTCLEARRILEASPYARTGLVDVLLGVDTGFFTPADTRQAAEARAALLPGLAPDTLVLGSNAGTSEYKGWLDLLQAVSLLPFEQRNRLHVVLAGRPPRDDLLQRVDALGLRPQLTLTGLLADVRPALRAIDVGFVLSHKEMASYAGREMMAMGKPVIVSDVGGLPELLEPGVQGWRVPAHAPERIAAVLKEILADPASIAVRGAAARERCVTDYSMDTVVARMESVYAALCSRNTN
ncbi:MAG: glycosyltransferase, partial [Microvirgula sp.]